ncbi:MAG: glycosyltransferase family 4 protein [Anaerolineae bacterium]|nr:glycosyltransferase family 4 protein [Anaerolineae bacterium]
MRVAFLTPELHAPYGWARYALELARALTAQGIEVVALTQPGAALSAADGLADVRPVLPRLVPRPRLFVVRSLLAIARVRRATADCDLLHVVAEPYSAVGALAAGRRPLVVTAHGTYVPQTVRRRLIGALYRRAYRRAHLIAVSEFTAAQVRAALPGAAPEVIRNGVHVARFQAPAPAPARRGPTILATGGVKARKGTHLLVAALARVRQRVPDAQLVVTGIQLEPDYLASVQEQARALGLADCVHLPGQVPEDELRGWYQHADVFALPSLTVGEKFEGFGLVFLEASACGLPVIGTTGSGVAEAVLDGETGLLVPQDDVPALAEAITRVLTDEALRARLGAAGRAYAQTQDWAQVAGQVVAIYEQGTHSRVERASPNR